MFTMRSQWAISDAFTIALDIYHRNREAEMRRSEDLLLYYRLDRETDRQTDKTLRLAGSEAKQE